MVVEMEMEVLVEVPVAVVQGQAVGYFNVSLLTFQSPI